MRPLSVLQKKAGAAAGQGGRVPRHQCRSGHRADRRGRSSTDQADGGSAGGVGGGGRIVDRADENGQRTHRAERSEEHTSELQSLMRISYAVFCLKKKKSIT